MHFLSCFVKRGVLGFSSVLAILTFMATPIGEEIQVGGGARVGEEIIRMERESEDADVDVVSFQSQDSLWGHLRNCGSSLPIPYEEFKRRIQQPEEDEDIKEEVS